MSITFTLNGETYSVVARPGESLLDTLRERCGVISVKEGCGQGQCGSCMALVDGRPRMTCVTKTEKVADKSIVTLEGLKQDERQLIGDAFEVAAGLQCGFCIPGIALRAHHLLDNEPEPDREAIKKALVPHLCRCTGYVKIVDAIELIAKAKQGEALPPSCEDGQIGSSLKRFQAKEMAMGERPYVADLSFDGMLHGALVYSQHPRAKVISIDTTKAQALPGVQRVATAADVPGERWYGLLYNDWPGYVAVGEEVRYVGDVLASIAAVDAHTARQAAALVEVEYEVLEPVLNPAESLRDGAPKINPVHDNILSKTLVKRGDVDAAFANAAYIVKEHFDTQRIEHLFMEPESAVCVPHPKHLHLYSQGQGVFEDRRQIAAFLDRDPDEIFVELVPNGGGFGGKEDMSVQAHAALLAQLTQKPIKITLTRPESIRMHPKRHPIYMDYEVACDKAGNFTAARVKMLGDTGPYGSVGSKVLERAAGHACGPYRVPNVEIEAIAAMTNNPPCGAMRGFGVNQGAFAMESCIDMLAEKGDFDAWEIRHQNVIVVGDRLATGQRMEKSVGVKRCVEALKPIYDEVKASGKAYGIACGMKNSGLGNGAIEYGKARLVIEKDGTISLYNGFTEMGQGLFTILTQCAVEVTGIPAAKFRPKVDSNYVLVVGQTTGSRGTLLGGRAVEDAAKKLKADLDSGKTLDDLVGAVYAGEVIIDDTVPPDAPVENPKLHTAYGFAAQLVVLDEKGRVDRVVAAHDVGRALNPALCEGQIEGAIHMGLGYALSEDLPCENGMPVYTKMNDIGVLRSTDMPDVEVILIEEHEPEGPFGGKGLGEIGLVPTAGATANALARFDGTRHTVLPMVDSVANKATRGGARKAGRKQGDWH